VQPFVSGAISKTVNMPENVTPDDIFDAYVEAWRLGLKAIAIYRDNSKRSQPLEISKKGGKIKIGAEPEIKRRHLPDERQAITHKFNIAGHEGYITVGLYDDGSPGEIFLVMAKEGSTLSGVMDAFATSISLALQYGVPLSALVKKFSHMRFEPAGFTNNKVIPIAKSLLDYIFRWMALKFLTPEEQASVGVLPLTGETTQTQQPKAKTNAEAKLSEQSAVASAKKNGATQATADLVGFQLSEDAPPCTICGSSLMVRQGSCYHCLTCGSQGGCG
jgi:ribonucleoside-diphosphate reductase alpha chain